MVSGATFTTSSDRATFEAALTSFSVENFNSFTADQSFSGSDLTAGDLTIRNDVNSFGAILRG